MVLVALASLGLGVMFMARPMIYALASLVATWAHTVCPVMIEGGVVFVLVWITGWILRLAAAALAYTYSSEEAWQHSGPAQILGCTHLAVQLM